MRTAILLSAALFAGMPATVCGTVLTFDWGGANHDPVPQSYGDRVGSLVFPPPPNFSYGAQGGATPNISVTYGTSLRPGGAQNPPDPTRVFGDLTNVLYADRNGPNTGIMEIILSADEGLFVNLFHFDLAAVYNSVTGAGENLPAKSIKVLDGTGAPLFSLEYDPSVTDHESLASTYLPGNLPLRHKRFSWDTDPLTAQTIIIRIDFTQLITVGGSKIDRFGIDNIAFGQGTVLPAPGVAGVVAAAGLLAARRRRRD